MVLRDVWNSLCTEDQYTGCSFLFPYQILIWFSCFYIYLNFREYKVNWLTKTTSGIIFFNYPHFTKWQNFAQNFIYIFVTYTIHCWSLQHLNKGLLHCICNSSLSLFKQTESSVNVKCLTGVQLGCDLVTIKIKAYNLHYFYTPTIGGTVILKETLIG